MELTQLFFALSFVKEINDVSKAKHFLLQLGKKRWPIDRRCLTTYLYLVLMVSQLFLSMWLLFDSIHFDKICNNFGILM